MKWFLTKDSETNLTVVCETEQFLDFFRIMTKTKNGARCKLARAIRILRERAEGARLLGVYFERDPVEGCFLK